MKVKKHLQVKVFAYKKMGTQPILIKPLLILIILIVYHLFKLAVEVFFATTTTSTKDK